MADIKVNPEAPQLITDYINDQTDFSHDILAKARETILNANPNILEDWKWGAPNFNYNGMFCWLVRFKDHVGINFFKGVLIKDEFNLFEPCGNSEKEKNNRMIKYRSIEELNVEQLNFYLQEALRVNSEKIKVPKRTIDTDLPDYLSAELEKHEAAYNFYNTLPPGAKRDYIEWITEAKREATRDKRMATMMEWLAEGKKRHWKYEKC